MTARQMIAWPLLAGFCYLASSADLAIYESSGLIPLYGQVAVMALGLAILVFFALQGSINGKRNAGSAPAIYILLAYALYTMLSFAYSRQGPIAVDVLVMREKFALFTLLASACFQVREMRSGFELASIGLVVLASLLSVYDFIEPTFSAVPGRGAGFYLNPNDAAVSIVLLGLVASRRLVPSACLALWSIASVGVLATFSRGGWLMLIIAFFGLMLGGKFGAGRSRFVFVGVVCFVFFAVFVAYLSGDLYLAVARSPLVNFFDANTLARLGERGLETDDYSSLERGDVFWLGVERFMSSPFIGHGVGSTLDWEESVGTHNMIVMLGAELGFIGVAMYIALFSLVFARSRGTVRLMAVIMIVYGLVSHNQFDFIVLSLLLGYIVASLRRPKEQPSPLERDLGRAVRGQALSAACK